MNRLEFTIRAQPEPPRGLHIGTWVFFAKAHCCACIYFNLPKSSKVFLHNGHLQKHQAPMGLQPIPLIHQMNLTSIFKFAIFDQSILQIQIHASSKNSLLLLPFHNFFTCEKHVFCGFTLQIPPVQNIHATCPCNCIVHTTRILMVAFSSCWCKFVLVPPVCKFIALHFESKQ